MLTLHSTMLLLYRLVQRSGTHFLLSLHSTMLLLYLIHPYPIRISGITLHSTMLLLYLGQRFRLHLQIYFTFHYASTISNLTWEQYAVFLSLHSTMLLLYLFRLQSQSPIRHHFTFHYASTISTFRHIHPDPPSCFTFHYASTISHTLCCISRKVLIFTFHYASTISPQACCNMLFFLLYIPLCFYYISFHPGCRSSPKSLHSTMLLLYQKHCMSFSPFFFVFTFHYASTISFYWLRKQVRK